MTHKYIERKTYDHFNSCRKSIWQTPIPFHDNLKKANTQHETAGNPHAKKKKKLSWTLISHHKQILTQIDQRPKYKS